MKRIFIVDDEVFCIKILRNLIEHYQVPMSICGSALSGESAYLMIKELKPDIVFIDIEMPGMNGLELIKKLRSTCNYNVHFVIISAYDNFKYAQEAMRLDVTDFLLKPIDNDEFIQMIEHVFGFRFTRNQKFNEILAYIHDNYQAEIQLATCAKMFHMSSNHITRLFKQNLGVGFTTYKNNVRIEHAKQQFHETDKSIKEVCRNVGYANINYFYRVFKDIVGVTPKEYQENAKAD